MSRNIVNRTTLKYSFALALASSGMLLPDPLSAQVSMIESSVAGSRALAASGGGTIKTIAGTGTAGFSGDGGSASRATLNRPAGLALDVAGNLYIADYGNNVVRKVTPGGVISTVAGNGKRGFSGDGGPATAAQLDTPDAVAVDAAGNLYITDPANNRIRRVGPTGTITTFAGNGTTGSSGDGGPATSATLNDPDGVAVDTDGNVYIADSYNHVVRKVVPNGTISTIAGTGKGSIAISGDGGPATSAGLYDPTGIAVDLAHNLYIADVLHGVIRKVSPNGVITTLAGSHGAPCAVAVDAAGSVILTDANVIRMITANGNVAIAGSGASGYSGDNGAATDATLANPIGVAVDAVGNIYIADSGNNVIRMVKFLPAAGNQYLLAQVADGGGWRTTFNLINPSTATATYQLQLKDDSGNPLKINTGNQTGSSFAGSLGPGASVTLASSGPANLSQGIANVSAGAPLVASGIFSSGASDRPNFEAAVPSLAGSTQTLLLPFDNQDGKATGLALANTGTSAEDISFTFRAESGTTFYTGSVSLSAGTKTEFNLSEKFPLVQGQRGTLVMSAGSPALAALGLRFLPGGTFTSLPVYPIDASSPVISRQILSHVIDGGGWLSTITIVNLDSQPAAWHLNLFDTSGKPMSLELNGSPDSSFGGTVPPLSSVTVGTPGTSSSLLEGWADLTSNQRIRAQLIFDSITPGQPVFEAAVPAIADGQASLAMPYDNTTGLATGIAIANSGGTQASIQVAVRDQDGSVTDNMNLSLAAGAKTAFVLTDKAPNSGGKRGLVQLTTQTSAISALALRFHGPAFTTLPVVPADPAAAPPTTTQTMPLTITAKTTTGAEGTDAAGKPDRCATPVTKASFLNTDDVAGVWSTFDNAQVGDVLSINWIHPSGAVDAYQPKATLGFYGSGCLLFFLPIKAANPAIELGNWQVRMLVNGSTGFTLPFTVALPSSGSTNVALGKPAFESDSTANTSGYQQTASLAVDGNRDGNYSDGSENK